MGLFERRSDGESAPQAPARAPLTRPADDPAVQALQERVAACFQQVSRIGAQLEEALAKERAAEEAALAAAARGEDTSGALRDAQDRVATLRKISTMTQSGLERAKLERDRALVVARENLSGLYRGWLVDLLDEQEGLLWRVLDTQRAIQEVAERAIEEGIPIGIHPRMFWSIGFPGFPFVRSAREITTWLRHRSIAPRTSGRRAGGAT